MVVVVDPLTIQRLRPPESTTVLVAFAVIVDRQPNQELRFTDDIGLCWGLSLFHRFAGFGLASSHELTALALE